MRPYLSVTEMIMATTSLSMDTDTETNTDPATGPTESSRLSSIFTSWPSHSHTNFHGKSDNDRRKSRIKEAKCSQLDTIPCSHEIPLGHELGFCVPPFIFVIVAVFIAIAIAIAKRR